MPQAIRAIENELASYTKAALPSGAAVGTLARVTDNIRGVWIKQANGWVSLTGVANVHDFGSVGDGVTDDTAALQAAIASGAHVFVPGGTHLFTANLKLATPGQQLSGTGFTPVDTAAQKPKTVLLKRGNFDGIWLEAHAAVLRDIEVLGDTGNGSDGIWMTGFGAVLDNVSSVSHGGDGIRIGQKASSGSGDGNINSNGWRLRNVWTLKNTLNGLHVFDAFDRGDANAGLVTGIVADFNGLDGIRLESLAAPNQLIDNQFFGVQASFNGAINTAGMGIRIMARCEGHTFWFPYLENNANGPFSLETGSKRNVIWGVRTGATGAGESDNGTGNLVLSRDADFEAYFMRGVVGVYELALKRSGGEAGRRWGLRENASTGALEIVRFDNAATTMEITGVHNVGGGIVNLNVKGLRLSGVGNGAVINKHLSATATWDPPSVAAGGQTTTTIAMADTAVGNPVMVGFSQDLQGMHLTGYVSVAGTVTVVLSNGTAGAIDLLSGTLRVSVWGY